VTFQIAARCVKTGRYGVAITTRPMGVGSRCPFIEPGVGLTVTMARTDPRLGPLGINLLKLGYSAQRVIDEIAASDPHIEMRQICVIDRDGNAVARTGARNTHWSGALVRPNLVAMGNNLFSERTVTAMGDTWDAGEPLELEDRLLAALGAGRDAGGQNGGQHSSALLSYGHQIFPYCDLRVDEHTEPVAELRRLYDRIRPLLPFYYGRPAAPDEYGREDDWLARQSGRK
jgi:uncharacterized Ntn-hydrolase superfamily protein